jgi:RNA polymerase sigma-70 factor, ECF subfamily
MAVPECPMGHNAAAIAEDHRIADELYRNRGVLIGLAWRIIGDRELAEDIVQDVFLGHLEAKGSFHGASSRTTYLYRAVINRCIDTGRRRKRFSLIIDRLSQERPSPPADVSGLKDAVRRLLMNIRPEFRVPFVLAGVDGMSYAEIADILHLPMNTVRTRIHRCREVLRKKLEKMGYP